ncbi:Mitogen-activated protein kinase 7 [Bienertia sinuspersici]
MVELRAMMSNQKHKFSIWRSLFEVDSKYVPINALGKGSYGVVCSCVNTETNEKFVIKKINNIFENQVNASRTLRELIILRSVRHENVIALKDVMVTSIKSSFKEVYLVYELMDCDLHQIIRTFKDEGGFMTEYVVTRWYRAPELLLHNDNYGASVDVWSVGCIFAEISLNQLQLIINILGSPTKSDLEFMVHDVRALLYLHSMRYSRGVHLAVLYPHADRLALDLLQNMLVFDPNKRIIVTEALQHPYLGDLNDCVKDILAHKP